MWPPGVSLALWILTCACLLDHARCLDDASYTRQMQPPLPTFSNLTETPSH